MQAATKFHKRILRNCPARFPRIKRGFSILSPEYESLKDCLMTYQRKVNEAPVFKFPIEALEIIQDPLDFYAAMYVKLFVTLSKGSDMPRRE